MFMSSDADTTTRHAAILAELAEIGMAMARGLRDEMEAAETPEARGRAVAAFPRIARTVRQCVALEARLGRDAVRAAAEDQARERRDVEHRVRRRRAQVSAWMRRAICNDRPDDDDLTAQRMEDLRDRLDEDLLDADFADRPFDEVIAGLCAALGLDPDRLMGETDDDPDDWPEDPDDEAGDDGDDPDSDPGDGESPDDPGEAAAAAPDPPRRPSPWRYNYSRN